MARVALYAMESTSWLTAIRDAARLMRTLFSCHFRACATYDTTVTLQCWQSNLWETYLSTEHLPYNIYTGCNRRNGPNFGRVFLMLNCTEKTQNTYTQSWTVWEIMAIENCGLPLGPRTTAGVLIYWYVYSRSCVRENILAMVERSAWRMIHPMYTLIRECIVNTSGSGQAGVLRHHSTFQYDV
jgi:hypothetical protein